MCAIAGRQAQPASAVDPARGLPAPASFHSAEGGATGVAAMLEVLAHRGPDGRHHVECGNTVLGHARLAIRDLTDAARQPMATPDGRFVLAFNGEVYNHAELRADLVERGVTLRSTGDTEVLLHALALDGESVLERLNGEFALAFLDTATGALLLARDPYGVKPLSYVEAADGFWFASEPKALLEPVGPALRVANEAEIERFFVQGLMDVGSRTFFRDVQSVRPCHRILVEDGRIVSDAPYRVQPHLAPEPQDVRAAFERAVALRLEADVPVGATLSGGLDSGTLVTTAARVRGPGLPTFTAAMPDPALDESLLASGTAAAAGASPTFVLVTPPTIDEISALVCEHGAPVGSLSEIAKRRVMQAAARAGVKVLVEGKGADEVLAGYPHLQAARLASLLASLRFARFARESRFADKQVLMEAAYFTLPLAVRARLRRRARAPARAYLHEAFAARNPLPPPAPSGGPSLLKSALAEGLTTGGLPHLLRYADRATMAMSVEGRYPYLDPDFVRAVFALPDDALVSDGWTKRVLRDIARGSVPDAIVDTRRKVNFAAPDRAWLTGPLAHAFREHLTDGRLDARGWLAPGAGARLHAAYQDGRDADLAFRAFILEVWARAFLDVPTLAFPGARETPEPLSA